MKKLLLIVALFAMTIITAQSKPEIGVGMSRHDAEIAIDEMKDNIGIIDWFKYVDHEEWDDAITIDFNDGDAYMDFRFNSRNQIETIKITAYLPSPPNMSPMEMIRAIGGAADPETISEYGYPTTSSLTRAVWNNTIDTVTGKSMRFEMILQPVGERVKIYGKQTLLN